MRWGGGGKMAREVLLDEEGGDGRCRVGTKTAMLDIDADGDGRIVHGGESDEGGVVAPAVSAVPVLPQRV